MGPIRREKLIYMIAILLFAIAVVSALDVSIFTEDYYFPVVSDGETSRNFDEKVHTHVEDEYQSITKFDIDAMEGESFSPPMIELIGAKVSDALFPEDDVLALEIDGDSLFVDLYRQEEEEYAYELAVIYKCFKTGSRDIKVTIPYSQVDQVDNFFMKQMQHLFGQNLVWLVKIVLDSVLLLNLMKLLPLMVLPQMNGILMLQQTLLDLTMIQLDSSLV